MVAAVAAYNQKIKQVADDNGWGFFDIDAALKANVGGAVPVFPDLTHLNDQIPEVLFGPLFSLDGVHPSTIAQRLFADSIAVITNRTYGTSLPVPVCGAITCPVP
jgi:hypothetical protein